MTLYPTSSYRTVLYIQHASTVQYGKQRIVHASYTVIGNLAKVRNGTGGPPPSPCCSEIGRYSIGTTQYMVRKAKLRGENYVKNSDTAWPRPMAKIGDLHKSKYLPLKIGHPLT